MQICITNAYYYNNLSQEDKIRYFAKRLRNKNTCHEDQYLWRAVLSQALEDLVITSKKSRKLCFKRRAYDWFVNRPDEVNEICELAGIRYKHLSATIKPLTIRK
jgi:hypothetical protein